MIIKTPIQELIYVLDFFTEVYKGDKETIGSEFTKFVIKNLHTLYNAEKNLIIDSFDAGKSKPFYEDQDGKEYFKENFNNE